ncbi:MAG TPA: APC family permease [Bryobacteraceae bacterium]|jgi:amino acid transporter|nr:APC family permease [Bryobacteraceae bacterium]
MLSFISFWRAAAIVLSDLASSAYYAGGIAESAIGKSAPWFILAIMLFGFAIRAIYIESSSMFVRGGVYKVVHEAMGATLAKFSVSALMFDYVLTGPISAVSAGLYLAGLINELAQHAHTGLHVQPPLFAGGFALVVTVYFWWQNIIGIHESSEKALRIMYVTTVMVVMLIGWCGLTMALKGFQPVPLPTKANLHYGSDALGWLEGTVAPTITLVAILVGLGHSLLAMSGFETLAQVYRELEAPKLKNLKKTGMVVIVYSLLFTSLVSFFAVMLIPDSERAQYLDNLIGGLSNYLVGPTILKLLFHAFVVLVGTLILSGAVNTAIIGSNGVLNRVAEDGVLPDWFRQPHRKYGTTHRLINLVVLLQIITIVLSKGNVETLGEAYAFGVIWSFAMKALSVLVLRYKRPEAREWKVPLNFRIGGTEVPLGLILITSSLFLLALINVVTKKTATISGSIFTIGFFTAFALSERHNRRISVEADPDNEKFRLEEHGAVSTQGVHVRPGNILVDVSNPNRLDHLRLILEEINPAKQDVVAVAVHRLGPISSSEHRLRPDQICGSRETEAFTRVVTVAEKAGKHVELLTVPGRDEPSALVSTAAQLNSSRIVTALSPMLTPDEQARLIGEAWEHLPAPRPALGLEIISPRDGSAHIYSLGPHQPRLWPSDIDLVHQLWQELADRPGIGGRLHHRDVVSVALRLFEKQLHSSKYPEVVAEVEREISREKPDLNTIPVGAPRAEDDGAGLA